MEVKAFAVTMNTENQLAGKEKGSRRVLELVVRAPQGQKREQRAALNLALVLDRSGSMTGKKLEYVRQAAAHVLDLLAEGDRVALVAYDDHITLVAESTPISRETRAELKQRVAGIRSGGSTNLAGGWAAGCEQVARQIGSVGQVDRTLLLTDGLANVGITDLEALAVHARELAERGVSTSTFGVGEGYNEYLLEAMAQQGRGSFTFIADPEDIPQIFAQEFNELSSLTARDVEIELELPDGVEAEALGGLRCEQTGTRLRITLGSLMAGREQALYFNLRLPLQAGSEEIILRVAARARGQDDQVLETGSDLRFHYADEAVVTSIHPNQVVLQRAAQARMSHAANEALKLERAGQAEAGARLLEAALNEQREHLPREQVDYYHSLIERMRMGMVESDRKAMHYDMYLARESRVDPTYEKRKGRK